MSTDTTAMNKLFLEFRTLSKCFRFSGDELSANLVDFLLEREDVAINEEKEQIEKDYFDGVEKELNGDAISPKEYFKQTYSDNN